MVLNSWMNIQEDLFNLCDAFNSSHPLKKPFGTESCSVLIKLLPESKELFFSHVTGNRYQIFIILQYYYVFMCIMWYYFPRSL